jgi:hypothetical protein
MAGDCFFKTQRASGVQQSVVIDLLRQDNIFAVGEIMSNRLQK